MVPLSPNTMARLEMLFGPKRRDAARELLETECAGNLHYGPCPDMFDLERIRFAVLKLSGGNLEQLRRTIDEAKKDWRDTLLAADFGYDVKAHEYWWPASHEE